jgi:tetratricopeptide (TPR) repeat protein
VNRNIRRFFWTSILLSCGSTALTHAAEPAGGLDQALGEIAQRFDELSFATPDRRDRRKGFEALVETVSQVADANPSNAAALTWQGIVLSTYAGEVSALSAMKYANAARDALHKAETLDATALHGSVYTSLGALYSHVPGGFIGFGDDDRALEYLHKAIAMSPDDLDASFFLAELLVDRDMLEEAEQVLVRGLASPPVAQRPLLDDARREQMRSMLAEVSPGRG